MAQLLQKDVLDDLVVPERTSLARLLLLVKGVAVDLGSVQGRSHWGSKHWLARCPCLLCTRGQRRHHQYWTPIRLDFDLDLVPLIGSCDQGICSVDRIVLVRISRPHK